MSNDYLVFDFIFEGFVRLMIFVIYCMDVLGKDICCLDLGVGVVGLVFEYIVNGLIVVGIDGLDYCWKN